MCRPTATRTATYAEITAYDHMIYMNKRMCKTSTGNLIQPDAVINTEITGPAIMAAFIDNVNTYDSTLPNGNPMPITTGSVAGGGDDLSSVPTNFPMTLEQMRSLLCSTGQLNLLLTPGIGSSSIDFTNGGVVNDLTGSVSLEYATGANNAQISTYTIDMDNAINALWYLLGPRCSATRWRGSITPTAPNQFQSWPASLVSQVQHVAHNTGLHAGDPGVSTRQEGTATNPTRRPGSLLRARCLRRNGPTRRGSGRSPRTSRASGRNEAHSRRSRRGDEITVAAGSNVVRRLLWSAGGVRDGNVDRCGRCCRGDRDHHVGRPDWRSVRRLYRQTQATRQVSLENRVDSLERRYHPEINAIDVSESCLPPPGSLVRPAFRQASDRCPDSVAAINTFPWRSNCRQRCNSSAQRMWPLLE